MHELTTSSLLSGPLITPQAKKRVEELIQSCEDEGGKILLDGRGVKVPRFEQGNFVGPTILEATTDMRCYQCVSRLSRKSSACFPNSTHLENRRREEIFGPVLVIVKADSLDGAIQLINKNKCEPRSSR